MGLASAQTAVFQSANAFPSKGHGKVLQEMKHLQTQGPVQMQKKP